MSAALVRTALTDRSMQRVRRRAMALALLGSLVSHACAASRVGDRQDEAVRQALRALYAENTAAFLRGDVAGVMRLRAPDFHAITPDGARHDRREMELLTEGVIHAVRKWNTLTFTIDSLHVVGDTAYAFVSQHTDRMSLRPDNEVHHLETWVTQREIWVRSGQRWLLWRVDSLRNQRRLIDGRPG